MRLLDKDSSATPVQMDSGQFEEHFASDERFRNVRYSPRNGRTSPSHSAHGNLLRHSLMKKTDDLKARKVRFYRNGDRFFKGIVYAVSSERFRTFESLLADLTSSPVCDKNVLPSGVRHIFNAETGRKIRSLHELEEGESYVCASTDVFKDVDYNSPKSSPNWISQNKSPKDVDPILAGLTKTATFEDDFGKHYIKPKLVTIIRNGPKPRKAVRVLLNKKTAHSFDQVLTDITEAIKLDSGAVRKIYTLDGRQVSSLPDFFREEDVFIAYGQERYSQDDFALDDNEKFEIRFFCKKEVKLVTPYKTTPFRQSERVTLRSPKSGRSTPRKLSLSNRSLNEESLDFSKKSSSTPSPKSPLASPRSGRKLRAVSAPKYRHATNGSNEEDSQMSGPPSLSQKYQIGRVIGEGNFAVVSECIDRKTNKLYALKKIEKKRCQGMERMVENEVSILRKVNHPNIILLAEELDTRDELYLVMEYVKGGDLFDDITMSTKYTEKDASGMIFNLASALKYLHGLKIVHRDVKPENLLVFMHSDGSKSLKLGDFGLATYCEETLYTVCGTPTYVAPEIIEEVGYDFKVDVWAAGVILYILLCGFPPFVSAENDQEELFDKILAGSFEFTAPFWDDVSDSAKELISSMLILTPDNRMSASDVMQHSWVTSETARDNDLHVAGVIQKNFARRTNPTRSSAGIRIVARTAMDKRSRYFQGRKAAGLSLQAKEDVEEEDADEVF